jgi:TrmH family RNA methyltransferase
MPEVSPIDIVLVRPSRPANVAAACRAMKNMGLASLVLVEPPPGLDQPEARALAYGAWDVLDAAQSAPDLASAVAGATFVVATSGKPPSGETWTPRELADGWSQRAAGGRMAVVFGPEASGLHQHELELCHRSVRIPTDPGHSSLNLAQAVLVIAYELFVASGGRPPPAEGPEATRAPERATAGESEAALADLREALLAIGFLNPQNPDRVLAELRRLAARAGLTRREVVVIRGLARQIKWAGER